LSSSTLIVSLFGCCDCCCECGELSSVVDLGDSLEDGVLAFSIGSAYLSSDADPQRDCGVAYGLCRDVMLGTVLAKNHKVRLRSFGLVDAYESLRA